jgi:hypothetical protein
MLSQSPLLTLDPIAISKVITAVEIFQRFIHTELLVPESFVQIGLRLTLAPSVPVIIRSLTGIQKEKDGSVDPSLIVIVFFLLGNNINKTHKNFMKLIGYPFRFSLN